MHIAVSRSVLQRRFQAALGRTVHDLIAGLRLKHVKQLLVETDLTLPAIADRTGFSHVEYLCSAFRKATGITPGTFRNRSHNSNEVTACADSASFLVPPIGIDGV